MAGIGETVSDERVLQAAKGGSNSSVSASAYAAKSAYSIAQMQAASIFAPFIALGVTSAAGGHRYYFLPRSTDRSGLRGIEMVETLPAPQFANLKRSMCNLLRNGKLLLLAVLLVVGGFSACPPVSAGYRRTRKEPGSWRNYWGRKLGIGWSDGYHAHGSPSSWTPTPVPRVHLRHWRHGWQIPMDATVPSEYPSVIESSGPTVLPVPQSARLRRLPPVKAAR